jgi:signal transduction histidine kinase
MTKKTVEKPVFFLKIIGISTTSHEFPPIKTLIGNLPTFMDGITLVIGHDIGTDEKGKLVKVLEDKTMLPVKEVKNGIKAEKNTIYTTASDHNIMIENGKFVLTTSLKKAEIEKLKTSNEELQQRNKELQVINAYMENFVHAVAHDMRSPVANLKYLTDVFASADTEGQKQYLPFISKSIEKLDNILRGLVQIIDIKGQQVDSEAEEIEIGKVIADVVDEEQELIADTQAKIIIENHYPHKFRYIRGYLEIILRNLLSNALKYRKKEAPPQIDIKVIADNRDAILIIKDNGIGMDVVKNKDKLFMPFKRFRKDIPGLGIGLHIIKTLIEKNGGKITVESEVGKGTEFRVYLKEF